MLELASLMARQARYRPDATAVVFENERLTYRQFWVRVARVGNTPLARGVGPGDKVATVPANPPDCWKPIGRSPPSARRWCRFRRCCAKGLASLLDDSDTPAR